MIANSLLNRLNRMDEATTYTREVKNTLLRVQDFCLRESGSKNHWTVGNRNFFFEWPTFGETDDGSVEGTVFEELGSTSKTVGIYYIDGTGQIIKFPYLPEDTIAGNANE